ncbi:MAG: MerR family transcriptional regulator [Gammaproteobacteria bacterium]|nr:MAG: MerR family transcriptional regulator [Gammaproteobacteria bacterium]
MRVSQLAKSLNVTPDTVRYYTRIGFLSPKKNNENGYKSYDHQDQKRLHFILNARHLGFSVKDIQEILSESDKGVSSCPVVRKLIEKRLEETEQQFQQTLALRTRMQLAIKQWRDKSDMEPTSEMICHLIEDFSQTLIEDKQYER